MVFLKRGVAILVVSMLGISPAQAQRQQSDLDAAREQLTAGHADRSLALVEPIISAALQGVASKPTAMCPGAAVAALRPFIAGNLSLYVENDWCEAMLVKGYALIELKRPAEAEQMLATLVGHAPKNPQYLAEYAYAVRVNGDVPQALALYKRAESAAAQVTDKASAAHWRAVALRGQGYCYTELQRWADAVKAYQRSLKHEPGNDVALQELQFIETHRPH